MSDKKRIEYIDVFKGIGILLMVIGHIGYGNIVRTLIYGYHMPMFFFISGYLYDKSKSKLKFKEYILKKVRTLIVPYYTFGLIYFVINSIIISKVDYAGLTHILYINTTGIPIESALWFLTAMFWMYLIIYFIEKINKKIIKIFILSIISVLGLCGRRFIPFILPFAIEQSFVGILFFYFGIVLKKYIIIAYNKLRQISKTKNILILLANICLYCILSIYNCAINMRLGVYNNIIIFLFASIIAIITTLYISVKIANKNNKILYILKLIGENSIVFVCFNHFVITIVNYLISLGLHNVIITRILDLPFVIATLLVICVIFKNKHLKKVFGK